MLKSFLRFSVVAEDASALRKSKSITSVAHLAFALVFLSSASLAVVPAKAAVTFGDVPISNLCPSAPNTNFFPGLFLAKVNNNTIYIAPNDVEVVDTTIKSADWNGVFYTPPGSRVINPGQVCVFEKCATASLTLTCIALPRTQSIEGADIGVSVEWPAGD